MAERTFDYKKILSYMALLAIGVYWVGYFDIIPDKIGLVGLLDDAIITILLLGFAIKVRQHGMEGVKSFFSFGWLGKFAQKVFTLQFILAAGVTALAIYTIRSQIDIIPDQIMIVGKLDDIGLVIAAAAMWLQTPMIKNAISTIFGGKHGKN